MNNLRHIALWLAGMLVAMTLRADILSDFTETKAVNAPTSAVLITDLKSGRELIAYNDETPLVPASIMKCVTTASLLEKTGQNYKYKTRVFVTGKVNDGLLDGDIVVVGSADPTVNTEYEPGSENIVTEIVDALKRLRINAVQGRIVVDESAWPGPSIPPTWQPGDLPHSYGTGTHGFNFEDNAVGRKSVANPAAQFRARLAAALRAAGIALNGAEIPADARRTPLGVHLSAPVDEIMRSCMMRSDNQFAEAMLRTLAHESGRPGTTVEGAKTETDFWSRRGADMEGVRIVDGSGLSRSNRVTARFMTDVLCKMSSNPYYASFFPLAGQEGTLKKFLVGTPLEGYIAMKTGSMKGIQCYAGYKLDENYTPTHSVVVIMNEMGDRAQARKAVEQMLLKTFEPEYNPEKK